MFLQHICSVGVSVEFQQLPVSVCTGSVWTQSWILGSTLVRPVVCGNVTLSLC